MISVCMATYNGAKYIVEQVDSILSQLSDDDELIVSDDGSTDGTIEILRGYNDSRIKIFEHAKSPQKFPFGYTTCNFENALMQASGDIIFLSDQDDVWVKDKIEKMVGRLAQCDAVLSDCSFVDSELNVLVESKMKFEGVKIGALCNLYKCGYLGSSMAFNSSLLRYILPIPKNVPHDLWIGLVAGYVGKFEILNQVTMLYRRHDANVSATNNNLLDKQNKNSMKFTPNTNSVWFKIKYRWLIAIEFIKFIIIT